MSRKIRCAIYTRKSSDDGLDQDFNSLDAQHQACAAYIASQRGEGWHLLPARYDDGGLSGGTLERPALQRLLGEVEAGRVDMIVVYKIDRLTRSLADFAKLVERLEAAGCSFVSVTQAFNTSSSMGRLTLNVLLSFAQFEREVTAERIRDKIAASKKRGLWMGGLAPLGYDAHPDPKVRSLVINEGERQTIETLFTLYAELGSLRAVEQEAARRGLRSKRHVFSSGRAQGGGPLSRGQIHHILRNPVYLGRIRHKGEVFDGQHAGLIEEALWERVQARLQGASARPRSRGGKAEDKPGRGTLAPLTGKFRDPSGDRLTPSHARKGTRRFRYYVSNRLLAGSDPSGWRLPAGRFEGAVAAVIADHLEQAARCHALLAVPDAGAGAEPGAQARALAARLRGGEAELLASLVAEGQLETGLITIDLEVKQLAEALGLEASLLAPALSQVTATLEIRRRGVEARIVAGKTHPAADLTLLRGLAKGHRWAAALQSGRSLSEVARQERVTEAYIRPRVRLAFLSPRIQSAILEGRQPVDLTLERLVRLRLPLAWPAQERLLGFGAP
jgi:DNA invertase Pin-like site-specific DNA recombinase